MYRHPTNKLLLTLAAGLGIFLPFSAQAVDPVPVTPALTTWEQSADTTAPYRKKLSRRQLLQSLLVSIFPERRLWQSVGPRHIRSASARRETRLQFGLVAEGLRLRLDAGADNIDLNLDNDNHNVDRQLFFAVRIGW